jgi:5-methylcytosine-specific restriction enzyme subunit McrC
MVAEATVASEHPADRRVRNLYHMLLYVWGRYDKDLADSAREVGSEGEISSLPNLFAHVLSEAVSHQLRRGLYRDYQPKEETGPRIRGQLQVGPSVGRMLFRQGLAQCVFDEFSPDTLHNRIIKTTLLRLLREGGLEEKIGLRVRLLLPRLGEVSELDLRRRHFSEVRLHRNNREYGLLLDICRFIYEEAMPTPHGEHEMTFRAFSGDWFKRKGRLFQNFVSRFYELRAADAGWEVQTSGTTFQHPLKPATPSEGAYLQRLEADVYVTHRSGRKVLIECKFYGKPFASKPKRRTEKDDELSDEDVGAEPEAPGRKISNEHLLQLGAYMDGLTRKEGAKGVEGLLLYVQPDEQPLSADFVREGVKGVSQPLRVRCLDLTKPWDQVEADLLGYLGDGL